MLQLFRGRDEKENSGESNGLRKEDEKEQEHKTVASSTNIKIYWLITGT